MKRHDEKMLWRKRSNTETLVDRLELDADGYFTVVVCISRHALSDDVSARYSRCAFFFILCFG